MKQQASENCPKVCQMYKCDTPASLRLLFTSGMVALYCATHAAWFDNDLTYERENLALENKITGAESKAKLMAYLIPETGREA